MIRESISIKMRGGKGGLRTISNDVKLVVTGRADLDRLAKIFDEAASAARKAGKHDRAIVHEAAARGCRANSTFKITMPSDVWTKMKGGA